MAKSTAQSRLRFRQREKRADLRQYAEQKFTHWSPSDPVERKVPPPGTEAAEEDLKLTVLPARVPRGKTKSVWIGLRVRPDVHCNVTLEFGTPPSGVTIEPMRLVVLHGHRDANVKVTAWEDAALGDFKVKVLGYLTRTPGAMKDLRITVAEC